jgi:uncharacterized repeat protein (TIGR01451 family)
VTVLTGGVVARAHAALAGLVLAPLAALLATGCGSSLSQLQVAIKLDPGCTSTTIPGPDATVTAKPGDVVGYVLQVANNGPGAAAGVHATIDLPADAHYQSTPCIDIDRVGATRPQALDPQVNARSPQWGSWSLAPPTFNADGSQRKSFVSIHFQVTMGGNPGDYAMQPRATSDNVDGDVAGKAQVLHLAAAASVRIDLSVNPTHVGRNQDVLYRITVDNFGSGPANAVNLLLALPTSVTFLRTESISGNASRASPVEPIPGALEVYFGGFTIPARTATAPGALVITLRARCTFGVGGNFGSSLQLTDGDGTVLHLDNVAVLSVTAPSSAPTPLSPSTPAPTPTPTPSGGD